jgi:hypothetical protein
MLDFPSRKMLVDVNVDPDKFDYLIDDASLRRTRRIRRRCRLGQSKEDDSVFRPDDQRRLDPMTPV